MCNLRGNSLSFTMCYLRVTRRIRIPGKTEGGKVERELEEELGEWNSRRRGKIRRAREEGGRRRQFSTSFLTLRCESMGSERD
jgi:hypothetical protein